MGINIFSMANAAGARYTAERANLVAINKAKLFAEKGAIEKQRWLDAAVADDVALFMDAHDESCEDAMRRAWGTIMMGIVSLLCSGTPETAAPIRIMRGAHSAIDMAIQRYAGIPDIASKRAISIGIETSIEAIRSTQPLVFMRALLVVDQYRRSVGR